MNKSFIQSIGVIAIISVVLAISIRNALIVKCVRVASYESGELSPKQYFNLVDACLN